MAYRRINPFLLGVCIAYISIGIAQLTSPHMLSSRLYLTVAIVSANLSVIEFLKALLNRLEDWDKRKQDTLPKRLDRKNQFFIKAGHFAVSLGYVMSVFFMITTPLKSIPDSEQTNILIGATTLFTFAFLFLSMVINEAVDYEEQELKNLRSIIERIEREASAPKAEYDTEKEASSPNDTGKEK